MLNAVFFEFELFGVFFRFLWIFLCKRDRRSIFLLPTQDNKLHLMTYRTVNIRRALQSALQRARADGLDSRRSVRASELLANWIGWFDDCFIDCC